MLLSWSWSPAFSICCPVLSTAPSNALPAFSAGPSGLVQPDSMAINMPVRAKVVIVFPSVFIKFALFPLLKIKGLAVSSCG